MTKLLNKFNKAACIRIWFGYNRKPNLTGIWTDKILFSHMKNLQLNELGLAEQFLKVIRDSVFCSIVPSMWFSPHGPRGLLEHQPLQPTPRHRKEELHTALLLASFCPKFNDMATASGKRGGEM